MPLPPTTRTILVVQRAWPQQENPALPLLPADAPAVLAGRVATASEALPASGDLVGVVERRARDIDLDLPGTAVLQEVCAHAVRAGGTVTGTLRLVCADLGDRTLAYALLTPIPVDQSTSGS